MTKFILTITLLLTTLNANADPVEINLTSNSIWFPSMILSINGQCRLDENAVKSRILDFTAFSSNLHCPLMLSIMEGNQIEFEVRLISTGSALAFRVVSRSVMVSINFVI